MELIELNRTANTNPTSNWANESEIDGDESNSILVEWLPILFGESSEPDAIRFHVSITSFASSFIKLLNRGSHDNFNCFGNRLGDDDYYGNSFRLDLYSTFYDIYETESIKQVGGSSQVMFKSVSTGFT